MKYNIEKFANGYLVTRDKPTQPPPNAAGTTPWFPAPPKKEVFLFETVDSLACWIAEDLEKF